MKGPLTVKVPRCIYYIFVYIHLYIYSWWFYIGPLVTFVPSNYLSVVLAVITVLPGKTKEWWWGPMGRLQGKPLTRKSHPLLSNSLGCVWMNAEIELLTSVSPILSLWSVAFWEHSLQEEDRLNVPTIQWHQRVCTVSEHRMHQNVAIYSDVSLIWVAPCWGTKDAEIGLLTRMAHLLVSNWCYAGERQQLCRNWSLHCQTSPCLAPSQRCVQLRPASHCHGDVREHVCCSGKQAPLLKRQCLNYDLHKIIISVNWQCRLLRFFISSWNVAALIICCVQFRQPCKNRRSKLCWLYVPHLSMLMLIADRDLYGWGVKLLSRHLTIGRFWDRCALPAMHGVVQV